MASLTEGMKGPRLEFVVRPFKGKRTVVKHSFDPTSRKIEPTAVVEDGGYLVYMPNGSSYRLSHKQLIKRGYDRQPSIINFETVNDVKSPVGRYKFAMDDIQRKKAWKAMEDQVIRACHRRHGTVAEKEDDYAESA